LRKAGTGNPDDRPAKAATLFHTKARATVRRRVLAMMETTERPDLTGREGKVEGRL
jgi:hypothetical protein